MLYTSYFSKGIALKENNIIEVSISKSTPSSYNGLGYNKLAPDWSIIREYKATGDWESYVKKYKELVLNRLNPRIVYNEIINMVKEVTGLDNQDVALLCWEKSGTHCHRELVAEWFNNAGILCEEWYQV